MGNAKTRRAKRFRGPEPLPEHSRSAADGTLHLHKPEPPDDLQTTEELAVARRLTASVGHEIKNALESLTNVVYFTEHDPGLSEGTRHYLLIAHEQIDRLTHVANLLLGFCRQSYRPSPVRLSTLAEDTLKLYASNIQRKKLCLEKEYGCEYPVNGFVPELRQVFSNVILNAIQSVPEGGKIVIRISAGHKWRGVETVCVLIADNGSGIASEHRKNIFRPFFTTKSGGTGLGLWLTHRIVGEHGGSIRVRSSLQPGRSGTVFQVCLPALQQSGSTGDARVLPRAA